ncbi:hypothetical protein IHQ71_16495 [Rhizobium sp. TH2]|uniref:hypothetical protein n=1 Tax=Rhizobium sp. TH2 TaxID=2775403 RepID=UPI00215830C6|nr:hypothetical protein [Rhizobium sp. TH2]UVC06849.1 hypothetical protein IHQ71_16495 [Rhizobium sp. TH2]
MADERMPEDMIAWMTDRNWGPHHDQWHFERRWDFWHARAARGAPEDVGVQAYIDSKVALGYGRSPLQEGEAGNGEDFLFMHRAMLQLLVANFTQSIHFLRGWATLPQDNADMDDPVPPNPAGAPPNPAKDASHPKMAEAITRVEARAPEFPSDEELGLFLQTKMRPVPGDAFRESPDKAAGLHNYLHNRWSDGTSPIDIGRPLVNTFNQRFWKLHGWIDHQWWRFRRSKGMNDGDAAYQTKLKLYLDMMNQSGHHHHFDEVLSTTTPSVGRNIFDLDFPS